MGTRDVKVAVVTGAASGIGRRAVERLLANGARVVVGDLAEQIEQLWREDDRVRALRGDVTDPGYAVKLVALAEESFGPVDRFVHSAGIMPAGTFATMPTEQVLRIQAVNYEATVHALKAALPSMRDRRRGQVVVLGSLTGYVPSRGMGAYSASKAAVNTLVETVAHEERDNGVQVLLVAPNAVKTPLLAQAKGGPKTLEKLATKEKSPLMITPDKVLDDIERALKKGKVVTTPGGSAFHGLRRLSPSLVWWLVDRIGG